MDLKEFDDKYRKETNKDILGIDEAGRGPLAGPLVVVGVVLPSGFSNSLINDSKTLTETVREKLFLIIKGEALEIFVEIIEPKEIDRVNILQATINANNKIASKVKEAFIITDYIDIEEKYDFLKIPKADSTSLSVAAASVIAKVTRDRIMKVYDKKYPKYGFVSHKGYGTKKHLEAIEKHGVLDIHRKSYKPIKKHLEKIKI